jgi:hypothetical protein
MKNKTFVKQTQPWGLFQRTGHRVMCSDGKIRACKMSSTADTFFSVPASIEVNGKTVTGYVTTETVHFLPNEERIYCFRHHIRHSDKMPFWPECYEPEFEKIMFNAITVEESDMNGPLGHLHWKYKNN